MASLQDGLTTWKDPLKNFGAVLLEQLVLKATSLPSEDKAKLCSKMEQWIAGSMFGLSESDVHPCLLKIMREAA